MVEKRLIICFLLYSGIICIAIKYEKKYFWDLFFGRKFCHLATVTPRRDGYISICYVNTLSCSIIQGCFYKSYTKRLQRQAPPLSAP
jgi:hypothetical protein